jgi:hypothetical protein
MCHVRERAGDMNFGDPSWAVNLHDTWGAVALVLFLMAGGLLVAGAVRFLRHVLRR